MTFWDLPSPIYQLVALLFPDIPADQLRDHVLKLAAKAAGVRHSGVGFGSRTLSAQEVLALHMEKMYQLSDRYDKLPGFSKELTLTDGELIEIVREVAAAMHPAANPYRNRKPG